MNTELLKQVIRVSYSKQKEKTEPEMEHEHWRYIRSKNDFTIDSMLAGVESFRDNFLSGGLDDGNVRRDSAYWGRLDKSLRLVSRMIPSQYDDSIMEDASVGLTDKTLSLSKASLGSVDAANFFCSICQYVPEYRANVVEIGGGYGALARLILQNKKNSQVTLIDLPETNVLSSFFLASCFPWLSFSSEDGVFFLRDESGEVRARIADPSFLESVDTCECDVVVNTRSFMEMELDVVDYYMTRVNEILTEGGVFFCANRDFKYKARWGDRPPFYLHKIDWGSKWELLGLKDKCDQPSITQVTVRKNRNANYDVETALRKIYEAKSSRRLDKRIWRLVFRIIGFLK